MEFNERSQGARIQEPGGGGLLTLWGKDDLLQVISNQRPVISSVSTTAILTCSPVTDTLITGYLKKGR
jgi:hypothetical protein